MTIAGLDHVAIPIRDVAAMLRFYEALGFAVREVQAGRFYCATFGANRINFHAPAAWQSDEFTLRGPTAQPGCGDFCFVWDGGSDALADHLARCGAAVVEGPVRREGGRGVGTSTYIRDPDGNLLEFIVYADWSAVSR